MCPFSQHHQSPSDVELCNRGKDLISEQLAASIFKVQVKQERRKLYEYMD